jgi:DNA adenine methylase
LFFRLRPPRAVLGDINSELIKTYVEVKWRVEAVLRALSQMERSEENYLVVRSMSPPQLPPAERAARFIYLNRLCFNGIYRTNRRGQFNVPYGGERSGEIPSRALLTACSKALHSARLIAADFESLLEQTTEGDFVYMDPPFSVRERRMFREYDASVFEEQQIQRLKHWMCVLADRNIPFLVSYACSDEADFLRDGFRSEMVKVRRNVSGFAKTRAICSEVLIYPDYLHRHRN